MRAYVNVSKPYLDRSNQKRKKKRIQEVLNLQISIKNKEINNNTYHVESADKY